MTPLGSRRGPDEAEERCQSKDGRFGGTQFTVSFIANLTYLSIDFVFLHFLLFWRCYTSSASEDAPKDVAEDAPVDEQKDGRKDAQHHH